MRVMTVLGTRPEIIRLSQIIPKLDQLCEHRLVHTGQNFTATLSDVFFDQLGVRKADSYLGVRSASAMAQIGFILEAVEREIVDFKPDRMLLLGDTNSALSAIAAKRMGVRVMHMEAGNRCFDDRVPEEVNRRIVDHCSDILLPYTERSKENLLQEGIESRRIFVTGNPILEVMEKYRPKWSCSGICSELNVQPGNYFLATLHRSENVDLADRLRTFLDALAELGRIHRLPVLLSTHPRTRSKIDLFGVDVDREWLRLLDPLPFFEFMQLQHSAKCVLSDSGTVQEECSILGVANVTLRDVTERPETLECGSNIVSGCDRDSILKCAEVVLQSPGWSAPVEYQRTNVSDTAVRACLGHWVW